MMRTPWTGSFLSDDPQQSGFSEVVQIFLIFLKNIKYKKDTSMKDS